MNKILLIIFREYTTRVKKKSFWIMTIIGPILLAALMIVPVWLSMRSHQELQKILVVDDSYLFRDSITSTKQISFTYSNQTLDQAQDLFFNTDFAAILYIPANVISGGSGVKLFYREQLGMATEEYVKHSIEEMIYNFKLQKSNVDLSVIRNAQTSINVITERISKNGSIERTSTTIQMAVGFILGLLVYMFIFLFGSQVMRGVIEEKSNRIVEVIVTSVKPFQLMMGKIIGVAGVGLTQFVLWLVLTFSLYTIGQTFMFAGVKKEMQKSITLKEEVYKKGVSQDAINQARIVNHDEQLYNALNMFASIDLVAIIACFLFYFLFGYFLYGALFAAIGAIVDNETDTQQFILPLTIPLVISFVMAQTIVQEPNGNLGYWLSLFPLTSPVIMMVRLPFGVPISELILSMTLLLLGFIAITMVAGKIYKTGILMYGKKITYAELLKWLRHRSA